MAKPHHYQLYSAAESRSIDSRTISDFGLPGFTLMELAASQAARHISGEIRPGQSITACCGKGNNAGDALAVARLLAEEGFPVQVYFPGGTDGLSDDAAANLNLLKILREKGTPGEIEIFIDTQPDISGDTIVIDGLFGTGISRDVAAPYDTAIKRINASDAVVFAMDIPSGLNADTGEIMGCAVRANTTFIFGTRKTGLYCGQAQDFCGVRIFCPLPFPSYLCKQERPVRMFNQSSLECLEARLQEFRNTRRASHKYENGNVHIVGGSPGLTGAVVMASRAAWNTGCGSVQVYCTKDLSSAYDAHLVEQTRTIIPPHKGKIITPESVEAIAVSIDKRPGPVVIGPGLGRSPESLQAVKELILELDHTTPVLIDADALLALDKETREHLYPELPMIVTPHPGEQNRMHGRNAHVPEDVAIQMNDFANRQNLVYAAKGLPMIIGTASGSWVSGYDTRIFSRTGFGDVLAGKTAGLVSQIPQHQLSPDTMADMLRLAMLQMVVRAEKSGMPSPGGVI